MGLNLLPIIGIFQYVSTNITGSGPGDHPDCAGRASPSHGLATRVSVGGAGDSVLLMRAPLRPPAGAAGPGSVVAGVGSPEGPAARAERFSRSRARSRIGPTARPLRSPRFAGLVDQAPGEGAPSVVGEGRHRAPPLGYQAVVLGHPVVVEVEQGALVGLAEIEIDGGRDQLVLQSDGLGDDLA